MTKQEYQSSTAIIIADNKLGHTNRMIELRYIDAEYIASLEAENAALTAKNAKLEKIIGISARLLYDHTGSCPSDVYGWEHPRTCKIRCNEIDQPDGWAACWREFLMQADDATQKEKP